MYVFNFIYAEGIFQRMKTTFFAFVKSVPFIKHKIKKVLDKQLKDLEEMFQKTNKGMPYIEKLPTEGFSEVCIDV